MTDEWTEWGVRRTWGDVGSVANFERDRRTAEKCAREWPGELITRRVRASIWSDELAEWERELLEEHRRRSRLKVVEDE